MPAPGTRLRRPRSCVMQDSLGWAAPIATTIAAVMTAASLGPRVTGWGFAVFAIGSVGWTGYGLLTGQMNLVWQNLFLTAVNLFGVWRWLGRRTRLERGGRSAWAASRIDPGEDLMPASWLIETPVRDRAGEPVGQCIDAVIECGSGRIRYAVLSCSGVSGTGETLHAVDWRHIRVDGGRLHLAPGVGRIDDLPVIPTESWPARAAGPDASRA